MTQRHWSSDELNALHAEISACASRVAIEAATWERAHQTENPAAEPAPPRGTYDYFARWFAACVMAACLLAVLIAALISFGDRDSSRIRSEQEAFLGSRGNVDRLQEYLRDCHACIYSMQARAEIAELLAHQEESIYWAARGDLNRLTSYIQSCSACIFKAEAEAQIEKSTARPADATGEKGIRQRARKPRSPEKLRR